MEHYDHNMLIKESISFQRGLDPKEALGVGDEKYYRQLKDDFRNMFGELMSKDYESNVKDNYIILYPTFNFGIQYLLSLGLLLLSTIPSQDNC